MHACMHACMHAVRVTSTDTFDSVGTKRGQGIVRVVVAAKLQGMGHFLSKSNNTAINC